MNKFPDIKNLLNELDKTKYFLESKNITFKENFNNLLSFFYKLRSIGANVNTENRKKSLIRFRKQKTNLSVFYNINFVLIKKVINIMPRTYFISGTDTNVGKTIVSAVLATKLEAHYFKPIQCGLNKMNLKDSEIVKSLSNKAKILNELYFLKKPLSPFVAAKHEKKN